MIKNITISRGAEKLANFLRERQWTPRKLGRVLDCDHSSVILWMNGRVIPSLQRALDLEREAGIDPADWFSPAASSDSRPGSVPPSSRGGAP